MKGKTVLITGATSGIGKQTAVDLAKKGAEIIFNSRDPLRGEKVREEIIRLSENEQVKMYPCDFSSIKSIGQFSSEVLRNHDHIHVLINNAGLWEPKRKLSEDGFEMTFAVNHLAPFLLTNLLLDRLISSAPSRIINVSSAMYARGEVILSDLQTEQKYNSMQVYSNTKLMNLLFTKSLAEKLKDTQVSVNALHPGFVATNLGGKFNPLIRFFISIFGINAKKGAETSIFLASDESVATISGEYFVKKKVTSTNELSKDMELAKDLWQASNKLCGQMLT